MHTSTSRVVLAACLCLSPVALAQFDSTGDLHITRPEDKQDVKATPAPPGATVLFDGTKESLKRNWEKQGGGEPAWQIKEGGSAQVGGGSIVTKQAFNEPILLHVEFRTPYQPEKTGQLRGNSGVYLQGRYEVQILDSYGISSERYAMQDCGSIYGVAVPKRNVCKAPTAWQAFDIEFHPPGFDAAGRKTAPARMTVTFNGVKIHEKQEIQVDNTTAGMGGDPKTPGPVMLQDHGDPVQYRNVWVKKLGS